MATPTAIKFWKGTFATYTKKLNASELTAGTLYFINEGALYLATANNAANLISPKRITDFVDLADGDITSTATAKAIVDFVNEQFTDENGVYKKAVKGLQDQLDVLKLATEGYTTKGAIKTAVDAKLDKATYDAAMTGLTGTVASNIATAKSEAITYAQGLTVNSQTFGDDKIIVLTAGDIKLEDKAGAVTVKGKVDSYDSVLNGFGGTGNTATVKGYIDAVTSAALEFKGVKATKSSLPTTGETGDVWYVKDKQTEYVWVAEDTTNGVTAHWEELGGYVDYSVYATNADVQGYKVNGYTFGIGKSITLDAEDVGAYSKTEVDGIVEGLEDRLDATEGVANGAAAAVATKVEQEAYNTKMGELDAAIADRYTKAETDAAIDADVKAAKEAVEAYTIGNVPLKNKPTLDSMGVTSAISTAVSTAKNTIDAYTVNGKAISSKPTLYGDDITLSDKALSGITQTTIINTTNVTEAIIALDEALGEVTGGTGGNDGLLAKKMNKVVGGVEDNIVTLTSTGDAKDSGFAAGTATLGTGEKVLATEKAVSDAIDAITAADVGAYSTTEVDTKLGEINAILTWIDGE